MVTRIRDSRRLVGVLLLCALTAVSALAFVLLPGDDAPARVGPKELYLALGDSVAYGTQPNFDIVNGYADVLFGELKDYGTTKLINMSCPGETTASMLAGGCPLRALVKQRYQGSQIDSAVEFIRANPGRVSPVTLTIGANDVVDDLGPRCAEQAGAFAAHLDALDRNLDVIVGRLSEALNGTGDLLVTTYYNPFQQTCPATDRYLAQLNARITATATRRGATVVDLSGLFAGRTCDYSWMCSRFKDIHPTTAGYRLIANAVATSVLGASAVARDGK